MLPAHPAPARRAPRREPRRRPVIAVVVPAYKVRDRVADVIRELPPGVEHVIVVDDACPQRSGDAAQAAGDPRVIVLRHARNRGVGGAVKTGAEKALALGADVVVKVDGDGQMDPAYLERLARPLAEGRAAYAKGNRFWHLRELDRMPLVRRLGNLALTFLVKAASGHWGMVDPTNGYVAIRADVLRSLDARAVADDYFFEISLLVELGKRGFRVADIPMPARYRDEASSLSIRRVLLTFPPRLLRGGIARFLYRHFWFDFTATAWLSLAAVPLLGWGLGFGAYAWWRSTELGSPATAGTVMLAALPVITGFQLALQALGLEVSGRFNSRVSPDDAPLRD